LTRAIFEAQGSARPIDVLVFVSRRFCISLVNAGSISAMFLFDEFRGDVTKHFLPARARFLPGLMIAVSELSGLY
jgi:hypothetical protein